MFKNLQNLILIVLVIPQASMGDSGSISAKENLAQCQSIQTLNHEGHRNEKLKCSVKSDDGDKNFYVLKLQGNNQQISFAHGFLMAKEAARGPLFSINKHINHAVDRNDKVELGIYQCVMDTVLKSVSKDFLASLDGFIDGIESYYAQTKERVPTIYKNHQRLREASVAIEAQIITDGIKRRMQMGDPYKTQALMEVGAQCGFHLAGAFSKLIKPEPVVVPDEEKNSLKLGCSASIVSAEKSKSGRIAHARNLDGELLDRWNESPTVFMIDETPSSFTPGLRFNKFLAVGSAGLTYPGGVSGFNEKGISVSVHQMQTIQYRLQHQPHTAEIGPYWAHRILREAGSIAEAYALIQSLPWAKEKKHFGGWSIVVSDGKTGESATIEFTGEKTALVNHGKSDVAQSNHFFSPDMVDQYYNYNFNKVLESISRKNVIQNKLNEIKEPVEPISWLHKLMANHEDFFDGPSSFGRSVNKGYTMMTTVALPPDKNNFGELWFSLGNTLPVPHSDFVGVRADFSKQSLEIVGTDVLKENRTEAGLKKSFELYTEAVVAWDDHEKEVATSKLTQSLIELDKDARIRKVPRAEVNSRSLPIKFVLGRVLHKRKKYTEAMQLWRGVLSDLKNLPPRHPYTEALIITYALITEQNLDSDSALRFTAEVREQLLERGKSLYKSLESQYGQEVDLMIHAKLLKDLGKGKLISKVPYIDFVVVYN